MASDEHSSVADNSIKNNSRTLMGTPNIRASRMTMRTRKCLIGVPFYFFAFVRLAGFFAPCFGFLGLESP